MQHTEEMIELLGEQARKPVSINILTSPGVISVLSATYSRTRRPYPEISNVFQQGLVDLDMSESKLDKSLGTLADDEFIKKYTSSKDNHQKGKLANDYQLLISGHFSLWSFQRFVMEVLSLVVDVSVDTCKNKINLELVLSPLNVLILAIIHNSKKPMRAKHIIIELNNSNSVHVNLNGDGMTMERITPVLSAMKKKGFMIGNAAKGYKVTEKNSADRFLMTIKFFRALNSFWENDLVH
jgi:hypothetical protein